MSRTLSTTGKAAIYGADTDSVFCHCIEISNSDSPPFYIRLVDNGENIVYSGNTYTAFPFSMLLPNDEQGQITEARIAIDNVSRLIVDDIRSIERSLNVNIYVVDVTQSPAQLEAQFQGFKLKNVTYDALTIEGKLTIEDYLAEPFPKDVLSGAKFPGLI